MMQSLQGKYKQESKQVWQERYRITHACTVCVRKYKSEQKVSGIFFQWLQVVVEGEATFSTPRTRTTPSIPF